MHEDLISHLRPEDFTGDLALVASSCGVDVAAALAVNCRGLSIYVPSYLPRAVILRYAKQQRDLGRSVKQIAWQAGLSERYVHSLLNPSTEDSAEQLQLFGDSEGEKNHESHS